MKYIFSFCFVLFLTSLSFAQNNDARLQQRAEKSELMNAQQSEKNAVKNLTTNLERLAEAVRINDAESVQVLRKVLTEDYAALAAVRTELYPEYKSSIEPAKLNKVKSDEDFMAIVQKAIE